MWDGTEEVSIGCSSPHTPIPEGTAERESALRKRGESRWYCLRSPAVAFGPRLNAPVIWGSHNMVKMGRQLRIVLI